MGLYYYFINTFITAYIAIFNHRSLFSMQSNHFYAVFDSITEFVYGYFAITVPNTFLQKYFQTTSVI